MARTIHVSTRKSELALIQTNQVIGMLKALYPDIIFKIGPQDTTGDLNRTTHLTQLGTGVFAKSLEEELLNFRSDFAVHCLKDIPTILPEGLVLGAICEREQPEDAVIIHPKHKQHGIRRLEELPEGSIIGTSSLRREAFLSRLYPHVVVKSIRGNIETRLEKLENFDDYDAIVIALAGFRRKGLGERIDQVLDANTFGYAVGQASVAIECRANDTEILQMLSKITHRDSLHRCLAERSLLRDLEGGCQISLGVHSFLCDDKLTLKATLLSSDGSVCITRTRTSHRHDAENLGKALSKELQNHPKGKFCLGSSMLKRALTYGDIEAPGHALLKNQTICQE